MPNIAKYDREEVIHKAMLLFWRQGYRATSTRDLQQAVNMRPGSIYAAFGSKEALYAETLQHYRQQMRHLLQQCLAKQPRKLDGLRAYFERVLFDPEIVGGDSICMLVKTLSELNEDQALLRETAEKALRQTELLFSEIVEQAQRLGELSDQLDPRRVARGLQVQFIGLRSYLKSTGDRDAVMQLLDDAFAPLR
ncbi:TetR/AcrR family transcriptional regulator [Marinobacterium jannaschii]|uniref:TetR/AcrR family transcriptional regulator n=1 Tax=Marinobacterium jannaschii TaxID=64970 RepID=UPI000483453B|nr:TetR/AcrR family transcriptional regulator [Marinobacterium jannaschii]